MKPKLCPTRYNFQAWPQLLAVSAAESQDHHSDAAGPWLSFVAEWLASAFIRDVLAMGSRAAARAGWLEAPEDIKYVGYLAPDKAPSDASNTRRPQAECGHSCRRRVPTS